VAEVKKLLQQMLDKLNASDSSSSTDSTSSASSTSATDSATKELKEVEKMIKHFLRESQGYDSNGNAQQGTSGSLLSVTT
jgi:hypothetical protein